MGCCENLAKFVLIICNIIFFLLGILMLGFGITAKVSPDKIKTIFDTVLPEDELEDLEDVGVDISQIVVSNAIFMIVVGVIALLIAGFGLIGACCLVRWMLIIYIICLVVLLLAEIALIIFAAVYNNEFRETMQKAMNTSLVEEFERGLQVNGTNIDFPTGGVELAWVGLQLKGKCCGAYNWTDYQKNTKWKKEVMVGQYTAKVPLSCCTLNKDTKNPELVDFNNTALCLNGDTRYINKENCFDAYKDKIEDLIENNKGIAIGIAAGIVGFEIILIILAIILCIQAGKERTV